MFVISTASHISSSPNVLRKMVLAGTDILRFNFSYGTLEEKIRNINDAIGVVNELGGYCKIMADLPNPKIRLGSIEGEDFEIEEGQVITLQSAQSTNNPKLFLPIQRANIGKILNVEQILTIGEGSTTLKVEHIISDEAVNCIALNSGKIIQNKAIKWKNQNIDKDQVLKNIEVSLTKIQELEKIHFVSFPLVDNEDTARKYKQMIEEIKWRVKTPKIAFKIETEEGLKNIEKIIPYCDVVIFERGTLAINTKFEKLGIYQKIIAKICNKHKKQMVVSTQILESTAENYIPQRGEILDITNMVLDGINGIMLCHETGIGDRPTYSISVAQKIISAVKEYRAIQKNES